MATHSALRLTFIAELVRKNSRKLRWSAMLARGSGADELVATHGACRAMRRTAKPMLIGSGVQLQQGT